MYKISEVVEEIVKSDDNVVHLGSMGLVNWSSYARLIAPKVENRLKKEVQLGSIVAALNRYFKNLSIEDSPKPVDQIIERLSVHTNIEGITFERTEESTKEIQKLYQQLMLNANSFITLTQGINEITIIAEAQHAQKFRLKLEKYSKIYDKKGLVGVSVKFLLKYLEIPNILFQLHKSIVVKKINIIEMISTATELTFVINKKDLPQALESLQKKI
ncbi:MAG: hypothetical protein S4CHLAM6_01800 [Chlamydiae bacterium]|nr:hypothetical protein [Chlamydiota bacterium]